MQKKIIRKLRKLDKKYKGLIGVTVYVKTECENIVCDMEKESGFTCCPFEEQCLHEECDNEKTNIFKTKIQGITNDFRGWSIYAEHIAIDIPISEIGRTLFFSKPKE